MKFICPKITSDPYFIIPGNIFYFVPVRKMSIGFFSYVNNDNIVIIFVSFIAFQMTLLIRITSPEGQFRVSLSNTSTLKELYSEVTAKFKNNNKAEWKLHSARPSNSSNALVNKASKHNLKHGQMLFLSYTNAPNVAKSTESSTSVKRSKPEIVEDDIDQLLWKEDTYANQNSSSVSSRSMKITDLKANPWDTSYLESKGIKKPSFHAYMRKIQSGIDRGKFAKLQHQQLSIAKTDSDKLSLSDLPNSVSLKAQQFRHVDQIVFENSDIANEFIQFWIETNSQRIGFCYGTYEKSEEIPLGIVAKVQAIYEPPQKNGTNKVELKDDEQISKIDQMAKACGLQRIGWIVSDLLAKDTKTGTVQYLRNEDTHFVSAEELITAASFQLQHPNPCRLNDTTGFYGSKFVTVIASGDKDCQIGFSGYQASNQAMDLVRSKVIVPTIDANELAYCLESSDELHIPEVFYRMF